MHVGLACPFMQMKVYMLKMLYLYVVSVKLARSICVKSVSSCDLGLIPNMVMEEHQVCLDGRWKSLIRW